VQILASPSHLASTHVKQKCSCLRCGHGTYLYAIPKRATYDENGDIPYSHWSADYCPEFPSDKGTSKLFTSHFFATKAERTVLRMFQDLAHHASQSSDRRGTGRRAENP